MKKLLIFIFIFVIISCDKKASVILYTNLDTQEYNNITRKLEKWDIYYKANKNKNEIWVKPEERLKIKMELAREAINPKGTKGWKLFDKRKWIESGKKRQAIRFEENIFRFLFYLLIAVIVLIALVFILLVSLIFILSIITRRTKKALLYLELMMKKIDSLKKQKK